MVIFCYYLFYNCLVLLEYLLIFWSYSFDNWFCVFYAYFFLCKLMCFVVFIFIKSFFNFLYVLFPLWIFAMMIFLALFPSYCLLVIHLGGRFIELYFLSLAFNIFLNDFNCWCINWEVLKVFHIFDIILYTSELFLRYVDLLCIFFLI